MAYDKQKYFKNNWLNIFLFKSYVYICCIIKTNMTTQNIIIGTKLNLNVNGKVRQYEVKSIENGIYKIFNKFVVSIFVDLDFINANLSE